MSVLFAQVMPWVAASALFLYAAPSVLGAKALVQKITIAFGFPRWMVYVIGYGEAVAGALQVASLLFAGPYGVPGADDDDDDWHVATGAGVSLGHAQALLLHMAGAFLAVSFLAGGVATHVLRDENVTGAVRPLFGIVVQLLGSYCRGTYLLPVLSGVAAGPFAILVLDSLVARKER